jgi:hypothetical protein
MISMTLGMYLLTLLTVNATQFEVGRDVVFFGFGLGLSFAVFNVVAQNAVKAQYISSATSVLQFLRQIGGTLGLAVLGSIVNQQLKVKMAADVPAAALQKVPAALRSQITNPQALFSNSFDKVFAAIPSLRYGVKLALADSIHVAFVIGLAVLILGLALTFFIREIPLRNTTAAQDRAAARAEALAS